MADAWAEDRTSSAAANVVLVDNLGTLLVERARP